MFLKKINLVWLIFNTVAVFLILLNVYFLFNKCQDDTWVLAHKTVVSFLTLVSLLCMLFHLYQIYSGKICLASSPHPTSANSIVIACLLAICVSCGHSYTLVFNLTFNDCDRLVEAKKGTALLLDNVFNSMMIIYPLIVLLYVVERKRSTPSDSLCANMSATFVNCVMLVLWARIMLYKCLMHQPAALLSQYFALKRVIALTERHIQKTKRFFSWVVLASITINVANFITTFLHSSMIKNVMAEEKYDYDTTVLLVLFAIQFLMPADYLFSFTMAATWSNLLIRYYQSGAFEYRQPSEEIDQIMQSSESNVPRKNQESHDSKTKKT